MSRYFLIAGKDDVRDITFRRHSMHTPEDGTYAYSVFVGDERWGVVTRLDSMPQRGWRALTMRFINQRDEGIQGLNLEELKALMKVRLDEDLAYSKGETKTSKKSLDSVDGFMSRWAAATYIIKTFGYWSNS